MDLFFSNWLAVIAIGSVAVISPGPDFLLTVRSSLACSKRTGIYTAIGIGAGNSIHASYSLIGIGTLVSESIILFNGLKILGAIYLIYLGVKSVLAKKEFGEGAEIQPAHRSARMSRWQAFKIGFLGNLLNPKATLFFLALFTQVIAPETPITTQIIYGLTVAVLALVWFSLVALLISHRAIRHTLFASSQWIERVTGIALIALGFRLAFAENK